MRFRKHVLTGLATVCLFGVVATSALTQQAPPAEGDEAALIAVLQSDARLFDKAKACQQLAVIGTNECVPVLASLLADEQLSHYARFGLEPIPDPSVDEALRASLGKLKGGLLVGVVNSIGIRRDPKAVDDLKGLLGDSDAAVAAAAAAALGRIATPEAVGILHGALDGPASLRPAVADACLTAADILLADGNESEAARLCDAMRQVDLPKHLQIAALHGVIRAGGSAGLPVLVECLRSDDKALFRVALRMAHEIGGPDVARTLMQELQLPAAEESKEGLVIQKAEYGAGDKWVDVTEQVMAAVESGSPVEASNNLAGDPAHGVVKKLRVVYTKDGQEQTVEVAEGEQFSIEGSMAPPHPREVLLMYALGDLGQEVALPVVLEAAQSSPRDIRLAAIRVLAELGDERAVPVLLETAVASQGGLAAAARDSLAALPGQGVDAALAAKLVGSEGPERAVLVDLAGRRGITAAAPTLLKLANSDDEQLRLAAIEALGLTVGLDNLGALIDRLVEPPTPEVASAAKAALNRAVLRMPDRDATAAKLLDAMSRASTQAKADLLDLVGVVGGAKALEGIAAAAKGGSEELQDAATRVLGEWMTPDAAPVLLDLAKSANDKFKVRCLRGYIRIARQLDVPPEQRIAMCREALAAAQRDDEKKLALEVPTRYPSPDSLALVVRYLDDAGLKEAATAAALTIAEKIVDAHPAPVAEAMKKTAQATSNAELARRAKALLNQANAKLE